MNRDKRVKGSLISPRFILPIQLGSRGTRAGIVSLSHTPLFFKAHAREEKPVTSFCPASVHGEF